MSKDYLVGSQPKQESPSTSARISSVGKRKTAIARVWIKPGAGNIVVNKVSLEQYFSNKDNSMPTIHSHKVLEPLVLSDHHETLDILCTVKGGGITGQAEALRHGISKALSLMDPELRPMLRGNGLLTRDSRKVERKKYGKHKARKSTQFSKR
jgi:small subunit ribosomal protein S9